MSVFSGTERERQSTVLMQPRRIIEWCLVLQNLSRSTVIKRHTNTPTIFLFTSASVCFVTRSIIPHPLCLPSPPGCPCIGLYPCACVYPSGFVQVVVCLFASSLEYVRVSAWFSVRAHVSESICSLVYNMSCMHHKHRI